MRKWYCCRQIYRRNLTTAARFIVQCHRYHRYHREISCLTHERPTSWSKWALHDMAYIKRMKAHALSTAQNYRAITRLKRHALIDINELTVEAGECTPGMPHASSIVNKAARRRQLLSPAWRSRRVDKNTRARNWRPSVISAVLNVVAAIADAFSIAFATGASVFQSPTR